MHQVMSDIEELKALTENEIHHKYMAYYIDKPRINTEKLYVLYSLMQNTSLPDMKKKRFIVTTFLVQLALDTHDLVPEDSNQDNDQQRIYMQLSVLAGDYYSGLYYQLLSEIGEIGLISVLSTAIKKINEAKMKLHYNDFRTEQELIDILKDINSTLFVYLANYIDSNKIDEFLREWLFSLFLSDDQKQYQSLFDNITKHNKDLKLNVQAIRQKSFQNTVEMAKQLPTHYQHLLIHVQSSFNIC